MTARQREADNDHKLNALVEDYEGRLKELEKELKFSDYVIHNMCHEEVEKLRKLREETDFSENASLTELPVTDSDSDDDQSTSLSASTDW